VMEYFIFTSLILRTEMLIYAVADNLLENRKGKVVPVLN
jgi:hypothetical protein